MSLLQAKSWPKDAHHALVVKRSSCQDTNGLCLLMLCARLIKVIEPLLQRDREASLQGLWLYGKEVLSDSCH